MENNSTDRVKIFSDYLAHNGLKTTTQRTAIVNTFLQSGSHCSTEDLFRILRKNHSRIGYATVHRTLKLLVDCGLASELNFRDGQARFEPVLSDRHHDHLVCIECGKVIEFRQPQIEKLQRQVADDHHFELQNRRHELYGFCPRCAANRRIDTERGE